ncbi:hypothetical protein I203_104196 [Kwoniella mangroviensis CBS 8507]|uniref:uncharacterized protein n=1 Tax=Kwoniella mangroviensis CBS 8507 TaxID=1296122 RepID=UPI00080CD468|nr:uncharacterized protein I203_00856 [Kwoniella mangroviensis CBS 8507]OCF70720.1 hypothetical protein I203_00856 [Kwoniella mangroviensis CBS 8507]
MLTKSLLLIVLTFLGIVTCLPVNDDSTGVVGPDGKRCLGQCYPGKRDETEPAIAQTFVASEIGPDGKRCLGQCYPGKREVPPVVPAGEIGPDGKRCLGQCSPMKRVEEERRCVGQCAPPKRDDEPILPKRCIGQQ